MSLNSTHKDTIIIGAGLTGLMLARGLHHAQRKVTVLEKSKGVGGRLATRRFENAKFDHGAQFYSLKEPVQSLHDLWQKQGIVSPWFQRDGADCFNSPLGMTALAKELATDLHVQLETKVLKLSKDENRWRLSLENTKELDADNVILTAPLPQALELLKASAVGYGAGLNDIRYAKAVVALIELSSAIDIGADHAGYEESAGPLIFSIADQQKKGISKSPAITVTLSAEASERFYEASENAAKELVVSELKKRFATFVPIKIDIKKWRYAQPLKTADSLYAEPEAQLFLAGDAFGGPSLNGAARSAKALLEHLLG